MHSSRGVLVDGQHTCAAPGPPAPALLTWPWPQVRAHLQLVETRNATLSYSILWTLDPQRCVCYICMVCILTGAMLVCSVHGVPRSAFHSPAHPKDRCNVALGRHLYTTAQRHSICPVATTSSTCGSCISPLPSPTQNLTWSVAIRSIRFKSLLGSIKMSYYLMLN